MASFKMQTFRKQNKAMQLCMALLVYNNVYLSYKRLFCRRFVASLFAKTT